MVVEPPFGQDHCAGVAWNSACRQRGACHHLATTSSAGSGVTGRDGFAAAKTVPPDLAGATGAPERRAECSCGCPPSPATSRRVARSLVILVVAASPVGPVTPTTKAGQLPGLRSTWERSGPTPSTRRPPSCWDPDQLAHQGPPGGRLRVARSARSQSHHQSLSACSQVPSLKRRSGSCHI
jgi:hypothetical protein